MIPFFILFGLAVFTLLGYLALYLSVLEIDVRKLIYNSKKKTNLYLIYIKLKLFGKITWIRVRVDNKRINKYKSFNSRLLKRIKLEFNDINKLNISLKKINFKMEIGVLDTLITSLSVGIISSLLSVIIAETIDEYSIENCRFKIIPVYSNKEQVKINLSCIINVKMVHIINILYLLLKEGSVSNGIKSSNRKSYEYCNEKSARYGRCKYNNRRSNRNSKWSSNNSCFKS